MKFYQSKNLSAPHGMFTRHQGISCAPYSSLNVSYGVGDDPHHIHANRQRIKDVLGITFLLSARQVHGDRIYESTKAVWADTEVNGYDALITDQQGVGLLIQQADCQAILIHDPARGVIAAIHCGWRGSVANIAGKTVALMHKNYGTDPARLEAAVSPSLGPCCAEFVNYRTELPPEFQSFQAGPNHFNFWEISAAQLRSAGIPRENIDVASVCTSCNQDYFSYRRAKKSGIPTGRQASVIRLP